jgi:hypothetical protein
VSAIVSIVEAVTTEALIDEVALFQNPYAKRSLPLGVSRELGNAITRVEYPFWTTAGTGELRRLIDQQSEQRDLTPEKRKGCDVGDDH